MASTEQDSMTRDGSLGELTEEELIRTVKRIRGFEGGPAGCVQVYDGTADTYDQLCHSIAYCGHLQVAKVMKELYPDHSERHKVRILDVAAGTGLVGVELHKLGFRQLEALDPSQGMLDVAATKGVYSRLIKEFMTDKQLPMEDNSFDSIVIAGGVGTDKYIPLSAWNEMIRLVTPGGFIVNAMNSEFLTDDFGGRLTQLMEELQRNGRLKQVTRRHFPKYNSDAEGVVFAYQVLWV